MCIAYPARITALDSDAVVVDMAGRTRRASLLMMPEVQVGAWVLVAAGSVVREIDAAEAADLGARLAAAMAATTQAPHDDAIQPTRPGGMT
jgi:hydrogenase assembly chaperone HypC/HupF